MIDAAGEPNASSLRCVPESARGNITKVEVVDRQQALEPLTAGRRPPFPALAGAETDPKGRPAARVRDRPFVGTDPGRGHVVALERVVQVEGLVHPGQHLQRLGIQTKPEALPAHQDVHAPNEAAGPGLRL